MMTIERVWYGDTAGARVGRALLAPLAFLYEAATRIRNRAFDAGWSTVVRSQLPAFSVGNLTVGGTGKTPVAAYLVRQFVLAGARPAIILRGYGADETLVHRALNPDVVVIADPDRVRAVARARDEGCDVVVLDDGFQHRRLSRLVDCVLVSAEDFTLHPRLLPAGPWRERFEAIHRASLVIVTRKTESLARAREIALALSSAERPPISIMSLTVDAVRTLDRSGELPLSSMRDARVLAVAGVGNPQAFAGQLLAAGLRVELLSYGDHHAYSSSDVDGIVARARAFDVVFCTLKDAVKLTPLWPRTAPPLWYVSQRVVLEMGAEHVQAAINRVLQSRT